MNPREYLVTAAKERIRRLASDISELERASENEKSKLYEARQTVEWREKQLVQYEERLAAAKEEHSYLKEFVAPQPND